MGYHRTGEMCSRATSPIEVAEEEASAEESCEQAEEEQEKPLTQKQYAELSLEHAKELTEIQDKYQYVSLICYLNVVSARKLWMCRWQLTVFVFTCGREKVDALSDTLAQLTQLKKEKKKQDSLISAQEEGRLSNFYLLHLNSLNSFVP